MEMRTKTKTIHAFYFLVIMVLLIFMLNSYYINLDPEDESESTNIQSNCNYLFHSMMSQEDSLSKIPVDHRDIYIVPSGTEPEFNVVSFKRSFPRADGDEAQQYIVDQIKLKKQCSEYPDTIVVDIGAFMGDFGLMAASYGCQVYVFEPIPFQYWLIKSSIEINGFRNRMHLFNKAVSSDKSTLKFVNEDGRTSQVPFDSVTSGSVFYVESITLDEVLPVQDIYLLKIDVEGYEPTVLFNASKYLFQEGRIQHMIMEYTPWWESDGKGPWKNLLNDVTKLSPSSEVYALHRNQPEAYKIRKNAFGNFYQSHKSLTLQTDIYVDFKGKSIVSYHSDWDVTKYA